MNTRTEIVNGVLRFPGQADVRRFPGYTPKLVDLDEFSAAFEIADDQERRALLAYASKFGLTQEMLRQSTEIFTEFLTRKGIL